MTESYTITVSNVWYDDERMIVKMFFLNGIPFTFDDLPIGHLYDMDLVKEANTNKSFDLEDVFNGSNYLMMEECHPCFDIINITNPEIMPDELMSYLDGEI